MIQMQIEYLNWQVKKKIGDISILLDIVEDVSVTIKCSCSFALSDLFKALNGISRRPENVKFDKATCFEEVVLNWILA